MKETQKIRIEEYDYPLPDNRIARYPLTQRDQSKLLVYKNGEIDEQCFIDLVSIINPGDLIVFNNTKVIQARLHFRKETGALIEVFCLEPELPKDYAQIFTQTKCCSWVCMVGNSKKWKEGILRKSFTACGKDYTLSAKVKETVGNNRIIEFSWDGGLSFAEVMDIVGELPIPPYLHRDTEEIDKQTYQTVYSRIKGSVAAPTAGLHFTDAVFAQLKGKGVKQEFLTLHVGAGTFKPVKSDTIEEHEMHTETFIVTKNLIDSLLTTNGKIIAVGTTSVRTLESLYYIGSKILNNPTASIEELGVKQWEPYKSEVEWTTTEALKAIIEYMERYNLKELHTSTQIIIAPGYTFHIVKAIVTNFHQPRSTLLLLVSAFVKGNWRIIYDYALEHDFRFLSYGDSSILLGE